MLNFKPYPSKGSLTGCLTDWIKIVMQKCSTSHVILLPIFFFPSSSFSGLLNEYLADSHRSHKFCVTPPGFCLVCSLLHRLLSATSHLNAFESLDFLYWRTSLSLVTLKRLKAVHRECQYGNYFWDSMSMSCYRGNAAKTF